MSAKTHTADFYVRIKASRRKWSSATPQPIDEVKAVDLRQNKPATDADEIAVRIRVAIPDELFDPVELPVIELEYVAPEVTATGELS